MGGVGKEMVWGLFKRLHITFFNFCLTTSYNEMTSNSSNVFSLACADGAVVREEFLEYQSLKE